VELSLFHVVLALVKICFKTRIWETIFYPTPHRYFFEAQVAAQKEKKKICDFFFFFLTGVGEKIWGGFQGGQGGGKTPK